MAIITTETPGALRYFTYSAPKDCVGARRLQQHWRVEGEDKQGKYCRFEWRDVPEVNE